MFSPKWQSLLRPFKQKVLICQLSQLLLRQPSNQLTSPCYQQPTGCWSFLKLLEASDDLETATEVMLTHQDIDSFQDDVGKPFIDLLKENIDSRFSSSKDSITYFSIFGPKKVPAPTSANMTSYGEASISTLIDCYGKELQGETVEGIEFETMALISEWKTYQQMINKQPKEDMKAQIKELVINETLEALLHA